MTSDTENLWSSMEYVLSSRFFQALFFVGAGIVGYLLYSMADNDEPKANSTPAANTNRGASANPRLDASGSSQEPRRRAAANAATSGSEDVKDAKLRRLEERDDDSDDDSEVTTSTTSRPDSPAEEMYIDDELNEQPGIELVMVDLGLLAQPLSVMQNRNGYCAEDYGGRYNYDQFGYYFRHRNDDDTSSTTDSDDSGESIVEIVDHTMDDSE